MLTRSEIEAIAGECGLERVASDIAEAALPASRLQYSAAGASRIGGLPRLPAEVEWPVWRGRPMSPIAHVALDELPAEARGLGLPPTGALAFFWDSGAVGSWTVAGGDELDDAAGWGYDPADADSASVVLIERADEPERSAPAELAREALLVERAVQPVSELTVPSYGSRAYEALNLTRDEVDAYLDDFHPRVLIAEGVAADDRGLAWAPHHQLLGHADVIQGDMQLECQLVTNGLYCGDTTGYDDPRARELEGGADDWRLLLQVGSGEDELGVMWGDVGRIYFWIRDADLRARRFDAVWLILQCS